TDRFVNLSAEQSLDLSPDGRYLAFAPRDRVRLWDLEKHQEIKQIPFEDRVASLLFDPDGKTLSAFSTDDEVSVLNLAYGDEKRYTINHTTRLARYSRDSVYLARAGAGRVWVSTGEDPHKLVLESNHQDNIRDIRFSQDNRLLATAGQDGMVRVWDLAEARELMRLSHRDKVLLAGFNADDTRLATIAGDGRIAIWSLAYRDPVAEACRRLQRNLTPDEWQRYLPERPYHKTCSDAQF
ncbi:MAG: hypothetical protein QNJ78_14335, partial [Gammaproteobacteria bacterium]|nr:hypothetical protein [Gammaproteobacteria bacterium]